MLPVPVQITRVQPEAGGCVTLTLDAPEGYHFAPGQFNMLYVLGIGEVPISVSGSPATPGQLVHTIRPVGTVTGPLCDRGVGDALGLRGPFGRGWPLEAARGKDVVIVAGGLGLAPLRPAIYELIRERDRYGQVAIAVGARRPEDLLYPEELRAWRDREDLQVVVSVDTANPGYRGRVGFVTTILDELAIDPSETVAMLCGPEIMMQIGALELFRRGVAPASTYISLERNMKCAVGFCGHCQLGPHFACKDGPVLRYDRLGPFFGVREA